jgi:hypothetical protein
LAVCGAINYELIGGDTTYVRFIASSRVLSLWTTLTADVRPATQHIIKAYPANFSATFVTKNFSVTVTGPCSETGYTADRKAIPAYPTPISSVIKYVLGVDGVKPYEFGFDYQPTTCLFYKDYTLSVKTYPGNTDVASFPWLTVDEG